jgi:hypothetical protein
MKARVEAYRDHGTPGLHAPKDRALLLAAVVGVLALADRAEIAEESSFAGPKGSISEWELGFNEGKAVVADAIRDVTAKALGGSGARATDDGPVKRLARVLVEDGQFGVPWEDASDDDRTDAMERAFAAVVAALEGRTA